LNNSYLYFFIFLNLHDIVVKFKKINSYIQQNER